MGFLVEAEPLAFFEIATFWLQSAWVSAEDSSCPQYKYYMKAFSHVIEYIENNQNIALYNKESFSRWIKFISLLPSANEQIYKHIDTLFNTMTP